MEIQKKLSEIGEREAVKEITKSLKASDRLLDGFGHDAAFVDISIDEDEVLVVNSDRSGLNLAYQLGLADAECVGDLGVSHSISDIVVSGGNPKAITVALLLPKDTNINFVQKVMRGAEKAADRYGAVLAGGDTKKNSKFAMVVTAMGTANKNERLTRSSAKKNDLLVVTGDLGSMLMGTIAFKKKLELSEEVEYLLKEAIVKQHPPFNLGRAFAKAKIANAAIDISDGLAGTIYNLCSASNVGAVIDESKLPINPHVLEVAKSLGIRPMQATLAGGDWQYLYAIPEENIDEAKNIAKKVDCPISVIGTIVEEKVIVTKTIEGFYRKLNRIENDSFAEYDGKGYFEKLETPQECFGEMVDISLTQEEKSCRDE